MMMNPQCRHRRRLFGLMLPLALLASACEQQLSEPESATELALAQPCDVQAGCVAEAEGFAVELSMGPEFSALQPFPVVLAQRRGAAIEAVTADFDMAEMDMGLNRYRLIEGAGSWHASVTLPVCMSGRSDWIADFEIHADGQRYQLQVPFVLAK